MSGRRSQGDRPRFQPPAGSIEAGFWLLYFVGVLWLVETPLQYQARPTVFLHGPDYVRDVVPYPGGLIEYGSAFLQQLLSWAWAGALLTTALAWGVGRSVELAWRPGRAAGSTGWRLLPAVLLFWLQRSHGFPWIEVCLGLIAVSLPGGLARWLGRWPAWRRGLTLLMAPVLYLVAGGLFMVWVVREVLREGLEERRIGFGGVLLLGSVGLPWVAVWGFFAIPLVDAWRVAGWEGGLAAVHPGWALLLVLMPVGWWVRQGSLGGSGRVGDGRHRVRRETRSLAGWRTAVERAVERWGTIGLAPALLIVTLLWPIGLDRKLGFKLEQLAAAGDWEGVVRKGAKVGADDAAAVMRINRALAHRGELLDRMFAFPQVRGRILWLHLDPQVPITHYTEVGDLLFELGQINRAERMAGESLELNGHRPNTLERLFWVNILKGEPQSARLFLGVLGRTPFRSGWAEHWRTAMRSDPTLADHEPLQRTRSLQITNDYVGEFTSEPLLLQCLARNRTNRMAADLLMAHYLLEGTLREAHASIARLHAAGHARLPRHCEEAMLLYERLEPERPLVLHPYAISGPTRQEFERFNRRLSAFAGNLPRAQTALAGEFGHTYWYYHAFGRSGRPGRFGGRSSGT